MRFFGRYTVFFATLVLLIIVSPFLEGGPVRLLPLAFMTAILMLLTALGIGRGLWTACAVLAAVAITLALYASWRGWALLDARHLTPLFARYAAGTGFYALAALGILRKLFSEKRVTGDTIVGGVSVYFLIGLFWTLVYHLVLLFDAGALSIPVEQLTTFRIAYYSFVSMLTIGFGDITPVSPHAQVLTILEAMSGQIYMAVFIARLVGLHTSSAK